MTPSKPLSKRTSPPSAGASAFTAFGMAAEAQAIEPGLHIVATPIGNLKDISFRALNVLAAAHVILAEDTRVTKVLLAHYGITTPLIAYHEYSAATIRQRMVDRLQAGEALALVSDAGTPLVSDPGYKLVEAALEVGAKITGIPGPSAVLSALIVSGLPTDRFFFEGFLPPKSAGRQARLRELSTVPGTLVFFESPRRVAGLLSDAALVYGNRPAAVARELTKLFETVRRGSLPELAETFAAEPPPRGEIVVLIGSPATQAHDPEREAALNEGLDAQLGKALETHSIKDAAALVSSETGQAKRDVYARALVLSRRMADREFDDA